MSGAGVLVCRVQRAQSEEGGDRRETWKSETARSRVGVEEMDIGMGATASCQDAEGVQDPVEDPPRTKCPCCTQ